MKRRLKLKLNNSGNTLVVVLIMVAFMTILGTVAVTSAMVGYKMKVVDKEVKRTFYSAEEVVDEIYAGLGMITMDTLKDAYLDVLSDVTVQKEFNGESYQTQVTNNEANAKLRLQFTKDMLYKMTQTAWTTGEGMPTVAGKDKFLELINTELIESPELAKAVAVGNIGLEKSAVDGRDVYTIRFTDCTVEYRTNNESDAEDKNTYFSRVTFDGVLDLDRFVNFAANTDNTLREFEKFSIIGCRGVAFNEGAQATSSGGIYAGVNSPNPSNIETNGGLVLNKSSRLSVANTNGVSIISKGRVFIDSAELAASNSKLWCVDLITTGENAKVNVSGTTYVSDDTEINGNDSEVKFSGSYYGFSKEGYGIVGDGFGHANSSAIVVNGSNTKLDISGINALMLGGRAYIDYTNYNSSEAMYLTGQSLALKGNQEVYLVPEIFMTEPGTETVVVNGVPKEIEVSKLAYNPIANNKNIIWKTSATGAETSVYETAGAKNTVTILLNADNFFGYEFLNQTNPFRIVKIGSRNYVYLNFSDDVSVTEYYDAIFATETAGKSKEWIASREYMRTMLRNNINELNQTAILNVADGNMSLMTNGSLINATPAGGENITAQIGGVGANEGQLAVNATNYTWRYRVAYRTLLNLPEGKIWDSFPGQIVIDNKLVDLQSAEDVSTTPFSYYVNTAGLINYCGGDGSSKELISGVSNTTVLYASTDENDEYTIPTSCTNGIIVTEGNVIVEGSFNGLIMAKGKVTVEGTALFDTSATAQLLDMNKDIRDCFYAYNKTTSDTAGSSAPSMVDVKYDELITFENWRKQSPTTHSSVLPDPADPVEPAEGE